MYSFKSGIIFYNRVDLSSLENEGHSLLLENLNIEDTGFNSYKKFVKAELCPPNKNIITSNIEEWVFNVNQDILPEWYVVDTKKYEFMFREAVKDFMDKNFTEEFGYYWSNIKIGKRVYHFMYGVLNKLRFDKKSNNYATSDIRKYLHECKLAKDIKDKYGSLLVSYRNNLLSMDGYNDYGVVNDSILSIPSFNLFRRCSKSLPLINTPYWLSTPTQTVSRDDYHHVQFVYESGHVSYDICCMCNIGVRPFFITKE